MANKDAPLAVEVPAPDWDKPGWVKVGVIAAVGFVVGVAWPRVLGVRLGPTAPGESAAAAASNSAQAGRAPEAPPASVAAKTPPSATPAASAPPAAPPSAGASAASNAAPTITVGKGAVLSCKTADGETKRGSKDCGGLPGLDRVVAPRIRKIATCAGAAGQSGKLSVVVHADFNSNKVSYDVGKSSTIQNPDAIAACLKTTFQGASAASTSHEHPRYTVAYTAHLTPSGGADGADKATAAKGDKSEADKGDKDRSERSAKQAPEKDEKPSDAPPLASGEAQVAWEVALVRDMPRTGSLVSRLPRGTRVKIASSKDGWYLIKFGEGYAHEGWVYRGAIGR